MSRPDSAPDGQAFVCPDCDDYAITRALADYHAKSMRHGKPQLAERPTGMGPLLGHGRLLDMMAQSLATAGAIAFMFERQEPELAGQLRSQLAVFEATREELEARRLTEIQ